MFIGKNRYALVGCIHTGFVKACTFPNARERMVIFVGTLTRFLRMRGSKPLENSDV